MKDALDTGPKKGSRLAKTGLWTAAIGVLAIAVGLLGARIGVLDGMRAMLSMAIGTLLTLIAFVTAGLGLIRGTRTPASWLALLAGIVGVGLTLNTVNSFRQGAPPIHDISTDTANPPAFVAIAPLRADAPNPIEYAGAETAAAQQKAYPDLQTLVVNAPLDAVFQAAEAVVADQGWQLVEANAAEGRIEATAETPWVRFKDDVVVRIASDGAQTRVDVRSKSRVGRGDAGVNAKRIRTFLAALSARLAGS